MITLYRWYIIVNHSCISISTWVLNSVLLNSSFFPGKNTSNNFSSSHVSFSSSHGVPPSVSLRICYPGLLQRVAPHSAESKWWWNLIYPGTPKPGKMKVVGSHGNRILRFHFQHHSKDNPTERSTLTLLSRQSQGFGICLSCVSPCPCYKSIEWNAFIWDNLSLDRLRPSWLSEGRSNWPYRVFHIQSQLPQSCWTHS